MASIPVIFQGVLTYADVGVGGGPMPGGPEVPPGYWGGIAPPLPTHPIAPGGPPPQVWPGPGYPAHPIAPGGPPPQIWPGPGHPAHPIAPGGQPPYPSQGPGFPTNPIVIPPDGLAPGIPSHPIYWPIEPAHPIAPGGPPPVPAHPIVIPGDDEANPKFEVKAAWTPQTGWVTVIVPTEDATVPTPSA
jgi:hypothetical protein